MSQLSGETPDTITPIPPSNPVVTDEVESKKRARSESDNSEVKTEMSAETPAPEKKKKKKVFI